MALAAVSSTNSSAIAFDKDLTRLPTVADIPSLIRHIMSSAPNLLPHFFGAIKPKPIAEAAQRLLEADTDTRLSMFEGKWAVRWEEYETMVLGCLGLPDETDIEELTTHLVSVGAFVVYAPSSGSETVVVLDPEQLVAALKSVMNHRYVGVYVHDEDTAALLDSAGAPRVLVEEECAMAKLKHRLPSDTLRHLRADEASYVKDHRVTRCFLEDVLLCVDRSRCGLRSSSTLVGEVMWELLQRLECGVEVYDGGSGGPRRATLFLPFLHTLRPASMPARAKLGRLGLGVSTDTEDIPGTVSRPVNGHMLQHRFVVARFPSDLMARVMQSVLKLRTAHRVVESIEGMAVWMSDLCVRDPSPVVENVVVWWSPDCEGGAPPAEIRSL